MYKRQHLYYGCRRRDEDFLYRDEWDEYAKELDNKLKLRLSLSREVFKPDGSKLYVQDLIWEDREYIADAILNKRGYVYICGEGKGMCHDVEHTLARILGEAKGADEEVGRQELKLLHDKNRMILDVLSYKYRDYVSVIRAPWLANWSAISLPWCPACPRICVNEGRYRHVFIAASIDSSRSRFLTS